MNTNNYVVKSLELHLFFARIMKEHIIREAKLYRDYVETLERRDDLPIDKVGKYDIIALPTKQVGIKNERNEDI